MAPWRTLLPLPLLLLVLGPGARASKIPWWNIRVAQEQGPNACVVEEIPGSKFRYYTDCKYWRNRDICGQKTVIRYECCEGFQQVSGEPGCTGVKPLKNVLETAREMGASKFVQYAEDSGLGPELAAAGAVTLFAPLDHAFDDLAREQRARLENLRGNRQNPILMYHVVNKRISSTSFRADMLLETKYAGNHLRINKYSSGIETVNCATIVRRDQEASNGVVHIVDGVLDPGFIEQRDLAEIIMSDGRFSQLAKAIEQARFVERLRSNHQPCTVLAPSDEAFQKIPKSRLQRILEDKDAREALLENHVIPHPVCLPAVLSEHRVRTLGEGRLSLDCDKRGTTVEGKRLRADFTIGRNGVLYMIDDLLLPDRAKSILQLAEQEKLYVFLQLVASAGLDETFDHFGEYTLFAPADEAFYALPPEYLQSLKTDKERARKFILYHATSGRVTTDSITDNQVIMSLDEQHPLRMQVYRKSVGVEDALIQKSDIQGMNGCVQIINKALTPANSSAGDLLRRDGNFSIFLQAMEKVMETSPDMLQLQDTSTSYTFFVPTDQAFNKLGAARLERIMTDMPYLKRTIRNHVVENMISSESFKPDLFYDIPTRQDAVDVVRKNGKLKVNDATMVNCDLVNTNGVIHVINKVLLPDH